MEDIVFFLEAFLDCYFSWSRDWEIGWDGRVGLLWKVNLLNLEVFDKSEGYTD